MYETDSGKDMRVFHGRMRRGRDMGKVPMIHIESANGSCQIQNNFLTDLISIVSWPLFRCPSPMFTFLLGARRAEARYLLLHKNNRYESILMISATLRSSVNYSVQSIHYVLTPHSWASNPQKADQSSFALSLRDRQVLLVLYTELWMALYGTAGGCSEASWSFSSIVWLILGESSVVHTPSILYP